MIPDDQWMEVLDQAAQVEGMGEDLGDGASGFVRLVQQVVVGAGTVGALGSRSVGILSQLMLAVARLAFRGASP